MDKVKSLLLVLSGVLLLTSCTGAAKKVAKEVVEEETEQIAIRGSKRLAKELGEELAEKDVKRLLKQLFSEDKLFADRWDKLPERLQASVLKALEHKPALLKFLKSDTKLLDEYIALGSKNALKSPELLSYYAEAMQRSRLRYGYSVLNTIDFVDEGAAIKFVSQGADRRLLGELKDGLLSIKLPDAAEDIFRQPLLRGELIPNTTYKVSSVEGQLKYTLRTDQLGRITQLEGVELRPHQLQQNVLQLQEGVDIQLGKAIEPGQGLKVKAAYHYEGTSSVPSSAKLNIKGDNGFLYSDVALNKAISTDYAKLDVAPILRAQGIPEDKIEKCLKECAEHPNLKKYLARDPKNAQRWMNTRNPVDDRLVARRADGRRVQNYAYAGNVYYFDPANNRGLASRLVQGRGYANLKNGIPLKDGKKLKVLSLEQLEELDRMYPDGITFSKQGHPDFTPVAYKRGGKPVIYDLSEFNQGKVERNGDINKANKLFARDHGFATPSGYTWHHIEGTRKVVLVRTDVHELIDHAGGISMAKVGKG